MVRVTPEQQQEQAAREAAEAAAKAQADAAQAAADLQRHGQAVSGLGSRS